MGNSKVKISLMGSFLAGCLFAASSVPSIAMPISNPSFETTSGWVYSENDPYGRFSGAYSSAWSSDGSKSYLLYRGTGYNAGGGWWGQIQQSAIDLTGVTTLLFDVHAIGVDANYLRVFVDSSLVGQFYVASPTWGGISEARSKSFDISGYSGLHALTIRMASDGDIAPADPKYYYIDNFRTLPIPEPTSQVLFILGLAAIGARVYAQRSAI